MKILIVAHYQNQKSPCAVFIHDQAKAYHELGHHVCIVCPVAALKRDYHGKRVSLPVKAEQIDGVDYLFVRFLSLSKRGKNGLNFRNAILAIRLFLLRKLCLFHPDVIHAHTLGFDSEIGAWLKKRLECDLVVTSHGSDADDPIRQGKREQVASWCRKADRIVCVGSRLKEKLLSAGVNEPISVIPNGYQLQYVRSDLPKVKSSIIQVGNLVQSKRNAITIQAFAMIIQKHPEAFLTIVGEGPEKEKLTDLCNQLHVEDRVCFTGRLSNREALERMAEAEYFVMVSAPEGFGIVYLEAMASGCLTLGAENEGGADIITSGETGFLLPVDNPEAIAAQILWAMENPGTVKIITEKGREKALQYSWKKNAMAYQRIFEELIRGSADA